MGNKVCYGVCDTNCTVVDHKSGRRKRNRLKNCHQPGKVILASDLCCKSSFSSLLKMKTLNALCSKPGTKKTENDLP